MSYNHFHELRSPHQILYSIFLALLVSEEAWKMTTVYLGYCGGEDEHEVYATVPASPSLPQMLRKILMYTELHKVAIAASNASHLGFDNN